MQKDAEKKTGSGAAVSFPPPIVAVLAILIGSGIGHFLPIFVEYKLATPERYWLGGFVVLLSGYVLGFLPGRQFRNSGQSVTPWSETPEIITRGVYRFTRNPMYLMMVLVNIGFAIILSEPWILILCPVLGFALYHIAIKPEEHYLEEKFGDGYRAYKTTVRRWL